MGLSLAIALNWLTHLPALTQALIVIMLADEAAGLSRYYMGKSKKRWDWDKFFKGVTKKAFVTIIVALCSGLDKLQLFPAQVQLAYGASIYYLVYYGTSVVNNAVACGVPVPERLKEVLASIDKGTPLSPKTKAGETEAEGVNTSETQPG